MTKVLKFVDLFAGLGGFHTALSRLGHECVFAAEIDDELRSIYTANYAQHDLVVVPDIRQSHDLVPTHDILCAGFPCQPFSKSGYQEGTYDRTRGTLFRDILDILRRHRPEFVILENVGNFEQHDAGRTWRVVRRSLVELGYVVDATQHVSRGGPGLLSPHHLGFPQTRARFFIVGRQFPKTAMRWPTRTLQPTSLLSILQDEQELSDRDRRETALTTRQIECIDIWNELHASLPQDTEFPSFPLWGDEIEARYPFEECTPYFTTASELAVSLGYSRHAHLFHHDLMAQLPNYAREATVSFPTWKKKFLRQNRAWFEANREHIKGEWLERLWALPPSLRKMEWNCKGEERDLWAHVLQFRPSGLRVKRLSSAPGLVAMTTSQIPIVGPRRRFLTRVEGLRLQGLPEDHHLPSSRSKAFKALGNAVHAGVVEQLARALLDAAPAAVVNWDLGNDDMQVAAAASF